MYKSVAIIVTGVGEHFIYARIVTKNLQTITVSLATLYSYIHAGTPQEVTSVFHS